MEKNFIVQINAKYHEEECSELLLQYFKDINENNNNKITEEILSGEKGIRNIGNTCYMNTAIQCLSNCLELRNYFLFGNPHKDINKNNILGYKGLVAYGFESIMKKLWIGKEKILDISKFKSAMGVCNERFKGMNQQDTHEFITFLIDSLHEDLNRVNNKIYIKKEERDMDDKIKSKIEWNNFLRRNQSLLVDLFYGLFKSTVTCQECKKACIDFNTFSSLSLNIKNSYKKQNSNDINIKIDELNLNLNKNYENKISFSGTENILKNNENINQNLNFQVPKENISLYGNKKLDIIESFVRGEEILVGGKENKKENGIKLSDEKEVKNNYFIHIRIIFFFYSSEEKPLQFFLPIKDKKELTYKIILLKISQIFNKNPYSLYLYHVDMKNKDITNVYGEKDYTLYEYGENKILLISEINPEIIKDNLNCSTNIIFYESFNSRFSKIKYTSREKIEKFLNQNRDNIIKYVNINIIEEMYYKPLEDKILNNHYMNMPKVYILTLKNFIHEEKKEEPTVYYYPKIVVFSKSINIINLYYEIFKMKKNIILEEERRNNNFKKILDKNIINEFFNELYVTKENFDINKIFKDKKTPFYLCIQKYTIENIHEKEIELLLNEKDKNRQLIEVLDGLSEQKKFPNEQIILKIYWNPKYNNKLKNYLRPEKIDCFFNKLIGINEESYKSPNLIQNGNISNNSGNKNNAKQNDEEVKYNKEIKNKNCTYEGLLFSCVKKGIKSSQAEPI